MGERTLIISDLHLGRTREHDRAASPVRALAPLWSDVDRLVLNGDSAEIHHPRTWGRAARCVLEIMDRCDADGVALTVLSGNHDPWLSDVRHLSLAGGAVFVTHGDVMHPAIAPWSPAAGRMRRAHEQAVARLPREIRDRLEGRLTAAQHASFAEWQDEEALRSEADRSTMMNMVLRPWSFLQVLHYWHVFPRLAAEFAASHAPEARVVVTGHTHRPGVWHIDDRILLNTGSFIAPTRPRAVLLDGDTISLHRIARRGTEWARLPRPLFRTTLPTGAGAAEKTPPPASAGPVEPIAEPSPDAPAAAEAARPLAPSGRDH
jgi:UDP-2,3-diacylglucosamine pyrophosphatase LpxH